MTGDRWWGEGVPVGPGLGHQIGWTSSGWTSSGLDMVHGERVWIRKSQS